MNHQQRATVRNMHKRALEHGFTLVTFWQDHFYTRDNRFGYPVCIQLQGDNQVEESRIIHWSSSKDICAKVVCEIDAYIAELEAQTNGIKQT